VKVPTATVYVVRHRKRRPNEDPPGTVSFDAMRVSHGSVEPIALSRLESTVVPLVDYFAEIEEALRSMHGPCLLVFAERQFIGRVERTDKGPLWLSAYWVHGGRVDSSRRWYLRYLVDDPQRHTKDLYSLTDCIHLVEHPDRPSHCPMFQGTYFDSDINFDVDPDVVLAALAKGTKRIVVGPRK